MEITITRTLGRKAFNNQPEQVTIKENNYFDFHEGLAKIRRNDKWEFIDEKGNVITKKGYYSAYNFENGLAHVKNKKGNHGYIDKNGNEIVKVKYNNITRFKDGFFRANYFVGLDIRNVLMDDKGKEIINLKESCLGEFHNDRSVVGVNYNKYYVIDRTGKRIIKRNYKKIFDYSDGFALVMKKKYKYNFIDKEGKEICKTDYDKGSSFVNGFGIVKKDEYWIYIDKDGNEALKVYYDEVNPFYEGIAVVKRFGKYGAINKEGIEEIELKYDQMESFEAGLARISLNKKIGYINKEGIEVIKPIYDSIEDFENGLAIVMKDRLYGVIDKDGKEIIKPVYEGINKLTEEFFIVMDSGLIRNKGIINTKGQLVTDCEYQMIEVKENNITLLESFANRIDIPLNELSYDVVIKQGSSVIEKKFNTPEEQNNYYIEALKQIEEENNKSQIRKDKIKKEIEQVESLSFENVKQKLKSI